VRSKARLLFLIWRLHKFSREREPASGSGNDTRRSDSRVSLIPPTSHSVGGILFLVVFSGSKDPIQPSHTTI
jgi:hypothetical protein